MKQSLETLTHEAFQLKLGDSFRIRPDSETSIDAELIEVRVLGGPGRSSKDGSSRRTPFALSFRTTNRGALPQRIYAVEHESMGSCEIFLVPVGPDATGMVYEAIFT